MITWDEPKRLRNIRDHGLDFAGCEAIFDGPMLTDEDVRAAYGEQRLKSLGWLCGRVVVLVWTERAAGPHLISCRYGDKHETQRYFDAFV
ncbi:BrnT family toxin [uncultured Thiodictyon sp.]|uniref:BrnT family toxin n=1 Tax=uncultured Thiodictyon sp. TaxID=1846217 RepID=UPI0025D7F2DC|nr:BrnT family toxin [uncultured Thiodictyon sp.]